jgi:hypothetical protein
VIFSGVACGMSIDNFKIYYYKQCNKNTYFGQPVLHIYNSEAHLLRAVHYCPKSFMPYGTIVGFSIEISDQKRSGLIRLPKESSRIASASWVGT